VVLGWLLDDTGAINSEIWGEGRERMVAIGARAPIKRYGENSEIAKPVCFLLSDYASYMIGECMVVDGGLTIGPN
jgi:hypothetical protein